MEPNGRTLTLDEVVAHTAATLIGAVSKNILISGVSPLDDARPGTITFVKATQAKDILSAIQSTKAAAIFVDTKYSGILTSSKFPILTVPNPFQAAMKIAPLFFKPEKVPNTVHATAVVDPSVRLGSDVTIHPYAVIGAQVEIGDNTIIHPHVVVYPRAKIGARCILHSGSMVREDCILHDEVVLQNGAIIGADGFGFEAHPTLGVARIPQLGNVSIGTRSEIGANTCVDRATLGTTRTGTATKLDNLVQVGHNCQIGNYSLVCGSSAIGGSSKIGDGVTLGGSVAVADHMNICSKVRVAGRSTITRDVKTPGDYGGYPILPQREFMRQLVALTELPSLVREWRKTRANQKKNTREEKP